MGPDRLTTFALCAGIALAAFLACYERAQTRFAHELHLTRVACGGEGGPPCPSCTSCHRPGPDREPHVPEAERCIDCHTDDAELLLARSLRPAHVPEPAAHRVRFSHDQHLAMPAIAGQCVGCHAGAVDESSELFPPMQRCFDCHEHRDEFVQGRCAPCHEGADLRRLVPRSFLAHDGDWLTRHGQQAMRFELACQTCHEQTECVDCHDASQSLSIERRRPHAVERSFVHRGDFLSRHAIEASADPRRCVTCHEPESCDACHSQRGVSASARDGRNPHPIGWLGDPGSPSFHGWAARRDVYSCASCHDRGSATNCIECHRVGGHGGSPHPPGFRSQQPVSATPCRYCHVP